MDRSGVGYRLVSMARRSNIMVGTTIVDDESVFEYASRLVGQAELILSAVLLDNMNKVEIGELGTD